VPINKKPVKNILHVDDDADIQTVIGYILEDEGHVVHIASNGREAIDFLSARLLFVKNSPDI
jgi:CheY-like chemotaxis protein